MRHIITLLLFISLAYNYSFLRFVQQWGPTVCQEYGTFFCPHRFTIYGLWPEHAIGHPQFCGNQFDPNKIQSIINPIMFYWPSYANPTVPKNIDFWKHEYLEHGTCMHMSEEGYFGLALELHNSANLTHILYSGSWNKDYLLQRLNAHWSSGTFNITCFGDRLAQVDYCLGHPTCQRNMYVPMENICPDIIYL